MKPKFLKILQVDSCLAANLLRAAVHALNFSSSDFEIEALKRRNLKGSGKGSRQKMDILWSGSP